MPNLQPGFNPNTAAFTFVKNSGNVPNQDYKLVPPDIFHFVANQTPQITQQPSWANVIFQGFSEEEIDGETKRIIKYVIAVNAQNANNLAQGFYDGDVTVKAKIESPGPLAPTGYATINLHITLEVIQPQVLQISSTGFGFIQHFGDPAPASQYLQITSGNNWSIVGDQPWLNFSQNNGLGSQNLAISVNPAGLSPGLYSASFLVDDGSATIVGYISYLIKTSGSQNDYLSATPEVLQFSAQEGTAANASKEVTVESSQGVSITANVNWLSLSETSFSSGLNTLTVSLQNTASLQAGSYPAEIQLQSDDAVVKVNVLLNIVSQKPIDLKNGGFYFGDARNRLEITTAGSNKEALLVFNTLGTFAQKFYKRKIPFFKNALSTVIGLESNILCQPEALPKNLPPFFIPVKPIKINIEIFEKEIGINSITPRAELSGMRFINGRKPKDVFKNIFGPFDTYFPVLQNAISDNPFAISANLDRKRLTYLPKKQNLPKDGIVCFSFYDELIRYECQITIYRTAQIVQNANLPINLSGTKIYTAFIDLSNYDLAEGDRVVISCGIIKTDIRIKNTDLPTTQLIWLNEWDCPEVFNCTGPTEVEWKDDSETVTLSRDGKEYTDIVEVKEPKSFKINSGQIYTDEEVTHLASLIYAKRSWFQVGRVRKEIIKNFRSIKTEETRRFDREFSLKFDSAEK